MDLFTQLIFTLLLAVVIYYFMKWYKKESHWKKFGVYEPKQSWKAFFDMFLQRRHFSEVAAEGYFKVPEDIKMYGGELTSFPVLTIRDPEILRLVFVKDFDSFVDRQPPQFNNFTGTETDQVKDQYIVTLTSTHIFFFFVLNSFGQNK